MLQPCSSRQRIEGLNDSIGDLKRLQKDIHLATHYMLREVKHEDACIFIGTTRSGKSTLINYLIGNKLIGEKVSPIRPVSIKKSDDPSNKFGPQIGTGPTSDTVFPSRWLSQEFLGLVLWDAPGFDDNRGVVQDITNAFYVYELFKNLKSAKLILVTDINDIAHDNIRPFLCLLKSIEKILKGKIRECFPGIAIVFSKVPKEITGIRVDKKYINELLEYQFLSSSSIDISEPAKDLIKHLIRNNQKIGFFKGATIGEITNASINEGIFEAVKSARSINQEILQQVSPSIAETSELFLYEVRQQLCAKDTFMKLQNLLRTIFIASVQKFENMNINKVPKETLYEQLRKLEIFKDKLLQAVECTASLNKRIDIIRVIDPSVAQFVDEYNLFEAATLMEFCDQLLDMQESKQFDINLHGLLIAAQSNINELMINVQLKLSKISKEEAEHQSSEVARKYEEEHGKLISQNEAVTKHNAEMMEQFHQQFERIAASQAQRDKRLMEYFEDLKREQKDMREREKYEREEAERREREREREREERERQRERDERREKENARTERELREQSERNDRNNSTHDLEIKINFGKLFDKFLPWRW